jgi:hypothetical protein
MLDFEWAINEQCINHNYFHDREICIDENLEVILGITEAISKLNTENEGFAFFDLGLSNYDQEILESLIIDDFHFYTNCGEEYLLESQMIDFIESLSTNNENKQISTHVASIITNISNDILYATGYEQALINVRSFVNGSGDDYFSNWHIDKSMEEIIYLDQTIIKNPCSSIFIFVLKGETTLFHPINVEQRDLFHLKANESEYTYGYDYNLGYIKGEGLDKIFDLSYTSSAKIGQGSVHLAGKECGAIHAVPVYEKRLFIGVFPGSKSNIKAMKEALRNNSH